MEKITREELIADLTSIGLDDEQVQRVIEFTSITGSNDEILASLSKLDIESDQFRDGIAKLKVLIDALRSMSVPESRFQIDLKIARGLDYYTGTVYETILNDYPEVGSVCSGGRYDDLAGYYTKTDLPGVGISIGLSRLFSALREIPGLIQVTQQSPAKVLVVSIEDEQINSAISTAAMLRDADIATILHTEPGKMAKKLRFADRMGFRYVVLIGSQEIESGSVSLKDMVSGSTTSVTVADLVQSIQE